jgi:hypothetical protein
MADSGFHAAAPQAALSGKAAFPIGTCRHPCAHVGGLAAPIPILPERAKMAGAARSGKRLRRSGRALLAYTHEHQWNGLGFAEEPAAVTHRAICDGTHCARACSASPPTVYMKQILLRSRITRDHARLIDRCPLVAARCLGQTARKPSIPSSKVVMSALGGTLSAAVWSIHPGRSGCRWARGVAEAKGFVVP